MNKLSDILKSNAFLPLSKKVSLNLICTNNVFSEKYNLFFKHFDISGPQYNVLRILRGQKGKPANLSTIQERMVHKNSNASRLIDKLLNKALVERKQCENNRRKIEIVITKKGLFLLDKIEPKLNDLELSNTNNLTENELQTLNILLEKLRQ